LPLFVELFKILSYTLLSLNCRWFTSIIPLARALEVILPSGSWHTTVPPRQQEELMEPQQPELVEPQKEESAEPQEEELAS
jgi:hypothetical protein